MHSEQISQLLSLTPLIASFNCSPSSFQAILPSNVSVAYAYALPNNSTFQVPAGNLLYPTSPTSLPALCVVQINVPSSATSAFSFGLFLPDTWNERFLAVGNSGFGGGINWLDMATGVDYGFASMSSDTGHSSTFDDVTWALNNPQSVIDFGYRAMHGSVGLAKQVVETYYDRQIKYNYFSGCSTGGRQGLREVQLYPEDFDGVLAGSPAWWTTHLQAWAVKLGLYNLPVTAPNHIPVSFFPAIGAEVLKQCDPQDGVEDNIISDPDGCNFFPEALLCSDDGTNQIAAGCLTAAQIGTLYNIYSDYVDTNQTFVFPHLSLGSEQEWPILLGSDEPSSLGVEYMQYMVLNNSDWDFHDYDYSMVQLADKIQPGNASACEYDISPFKAKGGKLLMYHGMADALIPAGSSTYFYKEVLKTLLPKGIPLDDFYRFFLVPGMRHCVGTPEMVNAPWYFAGGNQACGLGLTPGSVHSVPGFVDAKHDILLALMAWTENGTAPDEIIATKWHNDILTDTVLRQRPLCPFAKQAIYTGSGSVDAASSWVCDHIYNVNAHYN